MNIQASTKSTRQRDAVAKEKIDRFSVDGDKKQFDNDADFAIQTCRRFFTILGIWIPTDAGVFSWRIVLANILITICYFVIGIRVIPSFLYIFLDEKRPTAKLRLIVRCIFVIMAGIKYIMLQYHRRNIEKCMKHIKLDWLEMETTTSRNIMLTHARLGHTLSRICAIFTYAGAVLLAMLPIVAGRLNGGKRHNLNMTGIESVRNFAIPSHFGFSVFSETPLYEVIYTSQIIASFLITTISNACYSLAVVIVIHTCGQLNILMEKINELVDGSDIVTRDDSVHSRMSDIVKHHVKALRFISSAEDMLQGMCLIDLGGYPLEICLLGYICLLEFRAETKHLIAMFAYMILLVTFTFNIFSICYVGELLTREFENVGKATYMIDWHRLSGNKSLDLGLIIVMAHNPVSLRAGGAIQLSIRCFVTLMKTAMGYLNMLRAVMD